MRQEDTYAAFDLAVETDGDGIATDLRATCDGVAVWLHGATPDRSTDGRGALAAIAFPEPETSDAGRLFPPRSGGLRVPDLRWFLVRYVGRIPIALDLKVAEAVDPALWTRRGAPDADPPRRRAVPEGSA